MGFNKLKLNKIEKTELKKMDYICTSDGEIWYCSTDFGKILGYANPLQLVKKINFEYKKTYMELYNKEVKNQLSSSWLSSSSSIAAAKQQQNITLLAINDIEYDENHDLVEKILFQNVSDKTHHQNKIFVSEYGLRQMIMKAKIKNDDIKKFKKWIKLMKNYNRQEFFSHKLTEINENTLQLLENTTLKPTINDHNVNILNEIYQLNNNDEIIIHPIQSGDFFFEID